MRWVKMNSRGNLQMRGFYPLRSHYHDTEQYPQRTSEVQITHGPAQSEFVIFHICIRFKLRS